MILYQWTSPPYTSTTSSVLQKKLSECRTQDGKLVKPAILSIIPDFAQNYVPSRVNSEPSSQLTSLYDNTNREMSLAKIQEKAESVYKDMIGHGHHQNKFRLQRKTQIHYVFSSFA